MKAIARRVHRLEEKLAPPAETAESKRTHDIALSSSAGGPRGLAYRSRRTWFYFLRIIERTISRVAEPWSLVRAISRGLVQVHPSSRKPGCWYCLRLPGLRNAAAGLNNYREA